MNVLFGLSKYLLALPMAGFGVLHLMNADAMAGMAPFGGSIIIYFTGICLILFAVSVLIGKYDKLAAVLLALMLILFVVLLHLNSAMSGDYSNMFKDLAIAGGALMYAQSFAKDKSVIG